MSGGHGTGGSGLRLLPHDDVGPASCVELRLNLRNLLDRHSIVAGHGVAGHGANANLNLPGASRNATLTARYSF